MAHRKELILIKAAKSGAEETRVKAQRGKGKSHLPPVSHRCGHLWVRAAVDQGLLEDFPAQVFSQQEKTSLDLHFCFFQAQASVFLQPPLLPLPPRNLCLSSEFTVLFAPNLHLQLPLSFSQAMFHGRN